MDSALSNAWAADALKSRRSFRFRPDILQRCQAFTVGTSKKWKNSPLVFASVGIHFDSLINEIFSSHMLIVQLHRKWNGRKGMIVKKLTKKDRVILFLYGVTEAHGYGRSHSLNPDRLQTCTCRGSCSHPHMQLRICSNLLTGIAPAIHSTQSPSSDDQYLYYLEHLMQDVSIFIPRKVFISSDVKARFSFPFWSACTFVLCTIH